MHIGDKAVNSKAQGQTEVEVALGGLGLSVPFTYEDEEYELTERPSFHKNYNQRIPGPWVVGVYKSRAEVRFFIVRDRKSSILTSTISSNCESGA